MEISKPAFFPSLAGLRVILASFVFVYHFSSPADLHLTPSQTYVLIKCCMTAFFSLSGFVITYSLLNTSNNTLKDYTNFFLGKLFRILPLYLVLFLVPYINLDFPSLFVFFANLTLLKGYFDKLHLGGIGPAWSLTAEITFYLFAPLIVRLLKNNKKTLVCYLVFISGADTDLIIKV